MFMCITYSTTFSVMAKDIAEQLEFYGYRPVYPRTKNPIMTTRESSAYLYKRISALRKSRTKKTCIGLIDLRNSEVNMALDVRLLPSETKDFCLTVQSIGIVTLSSDKPTPVPMK